MSRCTSLTDVVINCRRFRKLHSKLGAEPNTVLRERLLRGELEAQTLVSMSPSALDHLVAESGGEQVLSGSDEDEDDYSARYLLSHGVRTVDQQSQQQQLVESQEDGHMDDKKGDDGSVIQHVAAATGHDTANEDYSNEEDVPSFEQDHSAPEEGEPI